MWLKMGGFISLFSSSGNVGVLALGDDVGPPADEAAQEAYESAERVVGEAGGLGDFLRTYRGNQALVQRAMARPSDMDVQQEAFEGMFPNVEAIKGFFELSREVDDTVGEIVGIVLRSGGADAGRIEADHAALLAQLALLFEAVFLCDWAKMSKPEVQNDFSFYRRQLSKNKGAASSKVPVDDSEASAISMFLAQGNPLLASVTSNLAKSDHAAACRLLAVFANKATNTAAAYKRDNVNDERVQTLLLSAVVAVAIYDRADGIGAFAKSSPVDVKKLVVALSRWDSELQPAALSTLQYSTKTFHKAPNSLKRLFNA